jgi:hypothetical protein
MATVRAYPNGLTMHVGGVGSHERALRGPVVGWSRAAVRRHTQWLYSVDATALDGVGIALTLTVRDCPPTASDWTALRRAWLMRVERMGATRVHWVVEWQKRRVPHLHAAVYFPSDIKDPQRIQGLLLAHWAAAAALYGVGTRSQVAKPIDGPLGWLQYLSKHAARGVKHYQRAGKPPGWETTGRLWGHTGEWPAQEPLQVDITMQAYYRFRRLARSWRVADARAAGIRGDGWTRITYARRMLRCTDLNLSRVRGVSEWIPESIAVRLLDVAVQEGWGAPDAASGASGGRSLTSGHADSADRSSNVGPAA